MTKVLVIRMLEVGDVASIALPALRHVKQQSPDAAMTCLTHAQGVDVIQLGQPDVEIMQLEDGLWPDNILKSIEAFLGLAEKIVAREFTQIINLDTAFMPCLLARFLNDAGETVTGNTLNISLQQLISQVQDQSLTPEYVNHYQEYMQSTFFGMHKWSTDWWESGSLPDKGYPEFYLKQCCGFNGIEMDQQIAVEADSSLSSKDDSAKIISIAISGPEADPGYIDDIVDILEDKGYVVNLDGLDIPLDKRLARIKASDLIVCSADAAFSFANAVGCPTLLITADIDPRILMPDYATDNSDGLPSPSSLAESIDSIFQEQ